ncbi:MAG: zinc metallopeptidase [Vulcanibacillus sp.]
MDSFIWILLIASFGLIFWAQYKVKSNYKKWSVVTTSSGITGEHAARKLLDINGLFDVDVEPVKGTLTDHYDPTKRVVRLSNDVFYGNSISSLSIASHEVGHAIQHKESYSMLVIRHKMAPVLKFTSGLAPVLIIGGFLFEAFNLIGLGIVFFATVVVFQLVTLPVEFNASSRARGLIVAEGFINSNEEKGVQQVLNAAALTYVASALYATLELLRYIMIFSRMRD